MAKISGLGWTTLQVDNSSGSLVDIRNDVTNFDWTLPVATQDTTGIDKYAMERINLLRDFTITLSGVFNPSGNSHTVLKDINASSSPAREVNFAIGGAILGITPVIEVLFTGYDVSRGNDGALTWNAPGVLANGAIPAWTT